MSNSLEKELNEILTIFSKEVNDGLKKACEDAAKDLAARTKSTAPKNRGKYRRSITAVNTSKGPHAPSFTWGVRGKEGRLTHLLVHGHRTSNGGHTKPNNFLDKALGDVQKGFEAAVERILDD